MLYEAPKIMIDDELVIQIFFCYLLDELGNLTGEQIADIITEYDSVNLLDSILALSKMEEKEMVRAVGEKGKETYELLPTGRLMSREFFHRVPLSIREKSLTYGKKVLEIAELERSIVCRIERTNDTHCFLTVRFLNEMGGPDLMNLKIYAPDFEQAKQMRERFYEKPSDIVTKIMNTSIKTSFL